MRIITIQQLSVQREMIGEGLRSKMMGLRSKELERQKDVKKGKEKKIEELCPIFTIIFKVFGRPVTILYWR